MSHLLRICRIIGQPCGNAVLIGVSGCGKKILTKLACFVTQLKLQSLTLQRYYSEPDFLDDMKRLFIDCGVRKQKQVLLIDAKDVEGMSRVMEHLHSYVSTGEIPGLFSTEELHSVLHEMQGDEKASRIRQMKADYAATEQPSVSSLRSLTRMR